MLQVFGIIASSLKDFVPINNIVFVLEKQVQDSKGVNWYIWIPIVLICIFIILAIIYYKTHGTVSKLHYSGIVNPGVKNGTGDYALDKAIQKAGYSYDLKQDIFYSNIDAWQRNHGYCRLYDESSAPLGMIIDCEPICFEHCGRKWLIEFWKGQYDLTTGCEVGIYATDKPDLNIPDVFKGTFYHCVDDEDLLEMSFVLKKNGKILFTRKDKHWWLTGFKLGEFSEPSELTMNITITLKDEGMRNEFVKALKDVGYLDDELTINNNTVSLVFDKPHTAQPITRTEKIDSLTQKKNKLLCDKYRAITGPYDNFPDKVAALRIQAPEMYKHIINIGKAKRSFEKIKNYLS